MQKSHFPKTSPPHWFLPVSLFISLPKHAWFCHGTSQIHVSQYLLLLHCMGGVLPYIVLAHITLLSIDLPFSLSCNNQLRLKRLKILNKIKFDVHRWSIEVEIQIISESHRNKVNPVFPIGMHTDTEWTMGWGQTNLGFKLLQTMACMYLSF